jgi:hypothetical protein
LFQFTETCPYDEVETEVQKTSNGSVTVLFNTAPTLNQYVVSLLDNPWLNKYCLKEILNTISNLRSSSGVLALKLTVFYSRTESGVEKKTSNTDDVEVEALQQQQIAQ